MSNCREGAASAAARPQALASAIASRIDAAVDEAHRGGLLARAPSTEHALREINAIFGFVALRVLREHVEAPKAYEMAALVWSETAGRLVDRFGIPRTSERFALETAQVRHLMSRRLDEYWTLFAGGNGTVAALERVNGTACRYVAGTDLVDSRFLARMSTGQQALALELRRLMRGSSRRAPAA